MFTVKEALLNRADGVDFQKIHKIAQRTNNMRFVSLLCLLYTMTNHYILGYDWNFTKHYIGRVTH